MVLSKPSTPAKGFYGGLINLASLPRSQLSLIAAVAIGLSVQSFRSQKGTRPRKKNKGTENASNKRTTSQAKRRKIEVNKSFITVLRKVLKVGMGKRELMNASALTLSLLTRTILSLWIAKNMGKSIEHFCNKDWDAVARSVYDFGRNTVLAAICNASLKTFTDLLALNIRDRLTRKAHEKYFERMNYYKANKVGEDKFENADQLIAEDIAKFATSAADVYSQSLKPVVDFFIFSVQLGMSLGPEGPFGMYTWFFVAAAISARVLPSYGKLAATEQELEGRFRARHAAMINNSEMVAFMRGEVPEAKVLKDSFKVIRKHNINVLSTKLLSDTIQGYVNKYFATVVGFALTARPVLINYHGMGEWSPGEIASYYVQTRQVMESLANAVLALFELQKRVGSLNGLSSRVASLFDGLEKRAPVLEAQIEQAIADGNGPQMVEAEELRFEHVDVYKPDGVLLLKDLNIHVPRGCRVIITGDNGCGKSSLFRVMCGLWPLVAGRVERPPTKDIYFLSQVNFVPVGSLREVMIYPETVEEFRAKGGTDDHLRTVLGWAHLAGFKCDGVAPELDDELEWDTALSPGQKQRMAFARLLYHNPKYAVLDECTNGVSPDIEADLYARCAKMGMAVFSISHKVELKRLHDFELHYNADENGTWEWIPLNED